MSDVCDHVGNESAATPPQPLSYSKAWYLKNRASELAKKRAQYARNPEAKRAASAAYRSENAEKVKQAERQRSETRRADPAHRAYHNQRAKAWYQANRDRAIRRNRATRLMKCYGMTVAEYDARVAEQGGVCAICRQAPRTGHLAVDHCHETGVVRGLLCEGCNQAIGRLGDTAEGLARAYRYLARFEDVMVNSA